MKEELADKGGQSILEIVIAMAILIISISAAVLVLFGGQSLSVDTQLSQEALNLARQSLEQARASAQQNFSGLTSGSSTVNEFTVERIVQTVDTVTKKVTGRVSWKTDAKNQKIELVTLVTDWRNVAQQDPGDPGGGGLTGNWCAPQTLGSVDLGPGNSATDLDVKNKIVYMTSEASASGKPDFWIVDATNGASPVILSSINTGPGLLTIDVSGNYAYAGNNGTAGQLQVIDITNPSNPILIASSTLPGVSGAGAVGNAIFYVNSKVYIATKNASGPEFHIYNVTIPSAPVHLGSRELGNDINDIFVSGNYAYLANTHSNEIRTWDVSDPANITEVSSYDPAGAAGGKSVYVLNNRAYLGRLTSAAGNELHVIDVTSPSALLNLGSKEINSDVNDIVARDFLAFLAASDPNQEFQVWNISDPANITLCSVFNFPQNGTGIDFEDNLIYVSVRSNDALRIITSAP